MYSGIKILGFHIVASAHQGEASSVDWSTVNRSEIVSAGWDGLAKVWDAGKGSVTCTGSYSCNDGTSASGSTSNTSSSSTSTPEFSSSTASVFKKSGHCYQAVFSPHAGNLFGAASGDGGLYVCDTRNFSKTPSLRCHHGSEVLTLDWDKYQTSEIVTGGVDRHLRVWDIRKPAVPVSVISDAHALAIRRVKCHPFTPGFALSCS